MSKEFFPDMTHRIFMIAGPNGAGKTTTALTFQPDLLRIYEWVNADEIARGLAPFHSESVAIAAGKLMIQRIKELLDAKKNFAFETTAAGINYLKHLKKAHELDYEISLMYLWLSNPNLAVKRVEHRVSNGGHHIPEEVVRRRFKAGMKNIIQHYLPIADTAIILDNSTDQQKVIAKKSFETGLRIEEELVWQELLRMSHA